MTDRHDAPRRYVDALGLSPHPEGGHYREIVRSPREVTHPSSGLRRSAMTSIYFSLAAGERSLLHVVESDELWLHMDGAPLELVQIDPEGRVSRLRLGKRPPERPADLQALVPAGVLQGVWLPEGGEALVACVVAPGFDFADFRMPPRTELLERFPAAHEDILRLTKPDGDSDAS